MMYTHTHPKTKQVILLLIVGPILRPDQIIIKTKVENCSVPKTSIPPNKYNAL